jgi:hypothetical protein
MQNALPAEVGGNVHRCIQMDDLATAIPGETAVLCVLNAADWRSGHALRTARGWAVYYGTDPKLPAMGSKRNSPSGSSGNKCPETEFNTMCIRCRSARLKIRRPTGIERLMIVLTHSPEEISLRGLRLHVPSRRSAYSATRRRCFCERRPVGSLR